MWAALRMDWRAVVEVFVFIALASAVGYLAVLVAWPVGLCLVRRRGVPWVVGRLVQEKKKMEGELDGRSTED